MQHFFLTRTERSQCYRTGPKANPWMAQRGGPGERGPSSRSRAASGVVAPGRDRGSPTHTCAGGADRSADAHRRTSLIVGTHVACKAPRANKPPRLRASATHTAASFSNCR
jgi:hypothetical protein